jgi:hypothetical protein
MAFFEYQRPVPPSNSNKEKKNESISIPHTHIPSSHFDCFSPVRPSIVHYPFFDSRLRSKCRSSRQIAGHVRWWSTWVAIEPMDYTHTHGFHPSMMMTAQRDDLLTGQLVAVGFGWGAPSGDARLSDRKNDRNNFSHQTVQSLNSQTKKIGIPNRKGDRIVRLGISASDSRILWPEEKEEEEEEDRRQSFTFEIAEWCATIEVNDR